MKPDRNKEESNLTYLEEAEEKQGSKLPENVREKADKPTKLPKKKRAGGKESYRPLQRN
ncbi:hypothetical protein KKH43_02770 [Patescibacteria group bacterium]|nr:hypothetical protein [Patescibacteria group bacterium]